MSRLSLPALLLCCASPALAQDSFDLDTVLIATFGVDKQADRPEGDRLSELFEQILLEQWMGFRMAEVPPFRDYDAATYVDACPEGQYVGCALVVGTRVQSEWVLGGQLRQLEPGVWQVTLHFIDVEEAQLELQFDVMFDGTNDLEVAAGVVPIFADVVAGRYQGTDIRGSEEEEEEEEEEPDEDEVLGSTGDAVDRGSRTRGKRKRVTKADLEEYEASEGETPWNRAGLSKASWRRWRNSGTSLSAWRSKVRGRQGEILLGATILTLGHGPWAQVYEGWYGLDDPTLETVETYVSIEQERGLERSWDFSVGAGILPWLDLTAFGGPRIAPYYLRVQRVVENQDTILDDRQFKQVSSFLVGGRVGFAPFPALKIRPTLHVGAYYWQGTPQDRVVQQPEALEVLPASWMFLLQGGPGFEAELGKYVYLWGRMYVDIPVLGRVAQESISTGPLLVDRPSVDSRDDGLGIAGSVGLTVRLRIRPKSKSRTRL